MIRDEMKMAFRDSIIKGRYNLLLGSGISLDSNNFLGGELPSAKLLCKDLCEAIGAPKDTTLNRVVSLLSDQQKQDLLTQRFKCCTPGKSLHKLPHYLWRRLFTFNIDDVIEKLYEESDNSKQQLVPLNYKDAFEPTPKQSELQTIHLHGWVQKPEQGYVFSLAEYARVMQEQNSWMNMLSGILSTESFIIAGTSLNEPDLEYYLSFRSGKTPRHDRGPSILVEPNPNIVTENDCRRYGLELFGGTFGEFLDWLQKEIPAPPTVNELIVPDAKNLFNESVSPQNMLSFFSDFEFVRAANLDLPATPTNYLYGRAPSWNDIDMHLDIERKDNATILNIIETALKNTGDEQKIFIIMDDAGSGKTTIAKRVVHDLIERGVPVLSANTTSRLDPDIARHCLTALTSPVVLFVDGTADHAEQIAQMLDGPEVNRNVVLIGTERGYRKDYLNVVFGNDNYTALRLIKPAKNERSQLLERYRKYGLIGTHNAILRPDNFVDAISGDPMAVAICRIMNDFKPLNTIIHSLWNACKPIDRKLYLCVALAEHCIKSGIQYNLLQRIAGLEESISHLFEHDIPLGIDLNVMNDEYVVPSNSVIAEQILFQVACDDISAINASFLAIAKALSPYVNRTAIMKRTPEARLAGRLFDCDKIVKPFLKSAAESFYIAIQNQWEWNSRYWEQRALLIANTDLKTAITYARHAIAIESHSYPMTTLGKVLLMQMEANPEMFVESYDEAFGCLTEAIEREHKYSRVTIHPYTTLLAGTTKYIELGGHLNPHQTRLIGSYVSEARGRFRGDVQFNNLIERLDNLL